MDEELLAELAKTHDAVITLEEHVFQGGYGQAVSAFYMRNGYRDIQVRNMAIEDTFVEHGKVSELRKIMKIDAEHVVNTVKELL